MGNIPNWVDMYINLLTYNTSAEFGKHGISLARQITYHMTTCVLKVILTDDTMP